MKILITTDLFTTSTNGVVTSVKGLWNELKSKGHDVRILTVSDSTHSRYEDGVYYVCSSPFPVYPDVRMPNLYRNKYIKQMIEWKPDIIHSQCEFFSFQFAAYIAKKTGAPIVHTYHTLYEQYVSYLLPGKRFGNWVVRVASKKRLKKVQAIIAPTQKVEGHLRGYGIENSISVVPSGISLEQHKQRISYAERMQKRRELNVHDDVLLLVNLGRVGTEKNLEELVNYMSKFSSDDAKVMLMIVGDGPDKENLEKLVDKLGIGGKVIFTGMVNPSEVHKYYQLGDVFVSASTSETQGLTYIEAAANGLPLLCRRDPCLDEVICEGVNGFQYENEEEFISRVNELARNAELRFSAGKQSESVALKFDRTAFGDAVEQLYEEIIASMKNE